MPVFALQRIEIDMLARESHLHPEVVRSLVRLGLLDGGGPTEEGARLARAVRLRRDLGLTYAGALLASDLLDRIEQLEQRLRRYETPRR